MQTNENNETETTDSNPADSRQLELLITEGDQLPFSFTKSGEIVIPEDMSYDRWQYGLRFFKIATTNIKRGMAGYIEYGKLHYGEEKALESVSQLEFELPLVNEVLRISSVPESIRKFTFLKNEHLAVLARSGLNEAKQAEWAEIASTQELSPSRLRESIKEGEVITEALSKQRRHGLYSPHGIRGEFDIWLRKMGGLSGLKKLTPDLIAEITSEFEPIAKLHFDLVNFLDKPKKKRKAKQKAKKAAETIVA